MKPTSSAVFAVTRYVAASWCESGEVRYEEADAHADAKRMARGRWKVDVLKVQWEPITGLAKEPRVLATYEDVPGSGHQGL